MQATGLNSAEALKKFIILPIVSDVIRTLNILLVNFHNTSFRLVLSPSNFSCRIHSYSRRNCHITSKLGVSFIGFPFILVREIGDTMESELVRLMQPGNRLKLAFYPK